MGSARANAAVIDPSSKLVAYTGKHRGALTQIRKILVRQQSKYRL